MASELRPRRVPAVITDARRNPGFALGAFGLSAWAYIGMSHTIAAYEGAPLGYCLGVAYEALVIGLAWEGRRRADRALETGRQLAAHGRWLGGAIIVGILSGALAAWHGWLLGEGIFAVSRAVAPVLAAVAVHLFFQSASSARNLDREAQIQTDRETAVLDMLDAVRLAQIAPHHERAARIADVNAAVTRVHRHVPAGVTTEVTRPHLESERTIRDVLQEAALLAGEWMPRTDQTEKNSTGVVPELILPEPVLPNLDLPDLGLPDLVAQDYSEPAAEAETQTEVEPEADAPVGDTAETATPDQDLPEPAIPESALPKPTTSSLPLLHSAQLKSAERMNRASDSSHAETDPRFQRIQPSAPATVTDWEASSSETSTSSGTDLGVPLTTQQISEVRVLRWEQNLSVHEVASRLGVSISAVSKYAPSSEVPTTETGSIAAVSTAQP